MVSVLVLQKEGYNAMQYNQMYRLFKQLDSTFYTPLSETHTERLY
jgi:hypothetical protein